MNALKLLTFIVSLGPLVWVIYQVFLLQAGVANDLGADPGKEIVLFLGEWAIRFLVLTLLLTPLRKLTGRSGILRVRRMLGLFTFFYASLHMLAWAIFLLELNLGRLGEDLLERPFITAGFSAWLLLLPLALTSTNKMVRLLGLKWRYLHRAVYGVAVLAVVHLIWLSKSSYLDATVYGVVLLTLIAARFVDLKVLYQKGAKGNV